MALPIDPGEVLKRKIRAFLNLAAKRPQAKALPAGRERDESGQKSAAVLKRRRRNKIARISRRVNRGR